MKIAVKHNSAIKIYSGETTFKDLQLFIKKEFQLSPTKYSLTYVDEDGDNITIASEEDMASAYELNQDKNLLKVKLSLIETTGEDEKVEFEVINEVPIVNQETKQEPRKEELPQKEEQEERKWHPWVHWGHWKRHEKSHQRFSQEGHHWHGRRFEMFHHMMNKKITETVDERVKTLIPCIKAQMEGGSFIKTFSVENSVVHQSTECKSCFATPIAGIRYKCLECLDFNLCQDCESKIQHPHNLLKMRYIAQEESPCQLPFKFFKGFWKHGHHHGPHGHNRHHGHRSHSTSSQKWGKEERATRKLAKIFGGQPQNYEEFAKTNNTLKKFELINKFASENGQEETLIKFRCEKIAKHLHKKPEEFEQIVKENMNLRPWELVHKLLSTGTDQPFAYGGKCHRFQDRCERKWEKKERKCKKSGEGNERSHSKRRHHQKRSSEKKLSQEMSSNGNKERTEKGKMLEALIGLFGGQNVKEYFELIEQHFSLGQEAIINKWLETHCSEPSA